MSVACILVQDRRCLSRIARSVYASISFITRVITAAGHASVIDFISGLLYVLDWNQKANTSEISRFEDKISSVSFHQKVGLKNCSNSMFRFVKQKREKGGYISHLVCTISVLFVIQIRIKFHEIESSWQPGSIYQHRFFLHFSSIDSDLDVVSTLDHPERATFDRETRLRMIQTNAPRCATLEVSKCRAKKEEQAGENAGTVQYPPTLILVRSTCSY